MPLVRGAGYRVDRHAKTPQLKECAFHSIRLACTVTPSVMHHLASVIKTVEVGGHTLIHPYTLAFSSVRVGFDYAVHCLKSGLTNNSYCRVLSYAARHGLTRLGWKTATGFPFPRPVSRTVRVLWSSQTSYSLFQGKRPTPAPPRLLPYGTL